MYNSILIYKGKSDRVREVSGLSKSEQARQRENKIRAGAALGQNLERHERRAGFAYETRRAHGMCK